MISLSLIIACHAVLAQAQYFYAANATTSGTWKPHTSSQEDGVYLIANNTGGDVSVTFDTSQISPDGNYSVTLYTPGCIQDDTCDQRGFVNVVGNYTTKTTPGASTATKIAQTNNFDKYDQIYFGAVNASKDGFRSAVRLSPVPGSVGVTVAQKIRFELVNTFQNSENNADGTASSASPTTSSQTAATAPTTVPNVTVTASATAHSGTLDQGAKIGIGVGVALGVLLIVALAALIYFRTTRRKQRSRVRANEAEDDSASAKAQLHGESSHVEMQGESGKAELPVRASRKELPAGSARAELPGKSLSSVRDKELPEPPGLKM